MTKAILVTALILASLFWQGCGKAEADSSLPRLEPPVEKLPASQTVNFKGVSFNYNPQIFGEVKSEEADAIPLNDETAKPDSVVPKHIRFTFNLRAEDQPVISVFPLKDYRQMYAVSKSCTEVFDQNVNDLRKVLKDERFRVKGEIFPAQWDPKLGIHVT